MEDKVGLNLPATNYCFEKAFPPPHDSPSNYLNISPCSTISMIGYGNVVPRTKAGKITAIVYACFGIPVYILYFMNMGKVRKAWR